MTEHVYIDSNEEDEVYPQYADLHIKKPKEKKVKPVVDPDAPIDLAVSSSGHLINKANGRFAPGNKGSTGNNLAISRGQKLRHAVMNSIDVESCLAVLNKLKEDALKGKPEAVKLFLEYAIGKPEKFKESFEIKEAKEETAGVTYVFNAPGLPIYKPISERELVDETQEEEIDETE